jgi:hypothetical protein
VMDAVGVVVQEIREGHEHGLRKSPTKATGHDDSVALVKHLAG